MTVRKPRPDCPRGPVCYYLGRTSDAGSHSVLFAIGPRRYEYTLTLQQIESVEHLCRKVSILKGLNFAKRKAAITTAPAPTSTTST